MVSFLTSDTILTLGNVIIPVDLKNARNRQFVEKFHGHIFTLTGTFWIKFTDKRRRSRALFGRFHGHFRVIHGHFFFSFTGSLKFTSMHFSWFTATSEGCEHFFSCSRAQFSKLYMSTKNIEVHFFHNVHGHIFKGQGYKNTEFGRQFW